VEYLEDEWLSGDQLFLTALSLPGRRGNGTKRKHGIRVRVNCGEAPNKYLYKDLTFERRVGRVAALHGYPA